MISKTSIISNHQYTRLRRPSILYIILLMKLTDILTKYLTSNKSNYKELRSYLSGFYKTHQKDIPTNQHISTTLYRLKKRGLVINQDGVWCTTTKGRRYIDNKNQPLKFFYPNQTQRKHRRILCMFDIPEDIRYKRNWLRTQLEILNFKILQQSVWIGPAPLPKGLITYIQDMQLLSHIKFLEVSNKDMID